MAGIEGGKGMAAIPLGKDTEYLFEYDASLLFPIPRQSGRDILGIADCHLPFDGIDRWTAYEVSWLSESGLPQVAVVQFDFSCHSPNLIESKSFKLYLNSFNQTVLRGKAQLFDLLKADLSRASGADVDVQIYSVDDYPLNEGEDFVCLDELPVRCTVYQPDSALLRLCDVRDAVEVRCKSHLLRSLCPVTGQPDWATVYIHYRGEEIEAESLLQYIASYRNHQGFHEQCVEQVFSDIQQQCQPEFLWVYARYMRRGGLDINPVRCSERGRFGMVELRTARQ